MNGSSSSRPVGNRSRTTAGRGFSAVREVLDELRNPAEPQRGARPERGDVRDAVLLALAERPGTGYDVVRALEGRGTGERAPGAGAVYPQLQLLADEGLVTAAEADGRRTWTLTPAGRAAAAAAEHRVEPDEAPAARSREQRGGIVRSGAQLAQAVALAAQSARREQVPEVVAVLDDARRRVLAILARD